MSSSDLQIMTDQARDANAEGDGLLNRAPEPDMARAKTPPELGEPIPYDPDFRGPLKNRSCTDIICLFLFLIFIGCWAGISIYAFKNGDPNTLLVPKDSSGSRCGVDDHVKDLPYLFFFDLTKCISPAVPFVGCPTKQVCVKECPSQYFFWDNNKNVSYLICDYNIKPQPSNAEDLLSDGQCARWYLPSSPLLNRCLYNIAARKGLNVDVGRIKGDEISRIKSQLHTLPMWMSLVVQNTIGVFTEKEDIQQFAQKIVDDLVSSWWKILIGIGAAVLTCIIYILMTRWTAAVMVWLSLVGAIAILSSCVYFTATKYVYFRDHPADNSNDNIFEDYITNKNTWLVLLIAVSIFLGIILLVLIFLRKRIVLAIALIREGSKAVSSVTAVLFFPIFPWILHIGITAFAIAVGLYLSTTGDPLYKIRDFNETCICTGEAQLYKNNVECVPSIFRNYCQRCADTKCKFISMKNPPLYPYLQAFNVIGFLWGSFFVSALGQMVLASVFATWYWTFRKSNVPFFAVTEATLKTLRYHIGTLAFGSLIITICRVIRIMLEYVDQKLKKYDNEITRAILCCCKCFFWCLEKFLKFINRNAYIMCAIHGKNFCLSAKDAFLLLARNILRVFVLDKVTDYLFFLGKVLLTFGLGAVAYVLFATDLTTIDNSGLNYPLVPVIAIMICTYFVSTIFFNVYTMAVDTLFLCFLEDSERNDGSAEKPYYMSKNLMKIFGKKNKRA